MITAWLREMHRSLGSASVVVGSEGTSAVQLPSGPAPRDAIDRFRGRVERSSELEVLLSETADYLTLKNKDITIVEMLKSIAGDISPAARYFLNMRLAENNVSIFTSTTVKEIADNHVIITSEKGEQKLDSIDNVILAAGAKPVNELESKLIGIVPKIFVIGDAMNPGKILQAVQQAFEVVSSL